MGFIPKIWQQQWLNAGAGVLLIGLIIALIVISKPQNACNTPQNFHVFGNFHNIDGVVINTAVMIAGVPVGQVCDLQYITDSRQARLDIAIYKNVKIPDDSAFVIQSEGFGGKKFIKVSIGGSPSDLSANNIFEYTQDSILFDELLAKIINMAQANQQQRKSDKKP